MRSALLLILGGVMMAAAVAVVVFVPDLAEDQLVYVALFGMVGGFAFFTGLDDGR